MFDLVFCLFRIVLRDDCVFHLPPLSAKPQTFIIGMVREPFIETGMDFPTLFVTTDRVNPRGIVYVRIVNSIHTAGKLENAGLTSDWFTNSANVESISLLVTPQHRTGDFLNHLF